MDEAPSKEPWIVSVDDHLIEPPSLWESRLPAKLRGRGPRATDTRDGVVWELDGERIPSSIISAAAGVPLAERTLRPMHWDEIRPGCFDPAERVRDMEVDGVIASLCFPTFPGFGGTRFQMLDDRELGLACIRAYNDFQIDEWAGSQPGRLFPMVLVPYWDAVLAAEELRRTAGKGAVALSYTENPSRLGFPSIHDAGRYWDPLWTAAQETEVPVCIHFGSSSFVLTTSDDSPLIVGSVAAPLNSQLAFTDWILSGIFERFPDLQVVFSESYLGWVPFMIEHADRHWESHFAWAMDRGALPRRPSEYFHRNMSVCLVFDPFGASQIETIGVDRVLAEADYPHPDSQWPNTAKVLQERVRHLPPEDQTKVFRGNAERRFHLDVREPRSASSTEAGR
jgi:predicted TIM-barrel fold metal-dependent hydrolase